jgi:hypothetical protein
MAGNVTGTIGADNVNLNNAATESTLAALLKVAQIDSKNLLELAKKSGVDAANLKDFDDELKKSAAAQTANQKAVVQTTQALNQEQERHTRNVAIITQLNESMTKLMDGTAQVSDVFGAFKNLPGIIGIVAGGLERLASIQQQNFEAYQKISEVGVNFGGSLTQLRQAAANSYLTLTEFGNIIKNNGQVLAAMGGSANEGAIAFSKASKTLMGDFGTSLMAMGYTTEQVNQGMIDYIAITGGRTKEEMKDQKALAAGTKGYLEELDRLADITGKSREELAKELKQKQEEADMELFKANMSVKEREEFTKVYNDAKAKYGQGAADNVLAAAQGRAVTTEAGKKYAALAPMATESLKQQYEATKKYGKDSQQARDAENAARVNNSKEFMRFSGTMGSATDVLKGNEQAARQAARDRMTDMDSMSALDKADAERKKRQAEVESSQADTMAGAMAGLKDLGSALWSAFSPLISGVTYLFGIIGFFAKAIAAVLNFFPLLTQGLALAGTLYAAKYLWESKEFALKKAQGLGGSIMGAAGSVFGGGKGGSAAGGASPLDAIGKAGGGIGEALTGLSKGLMSFANPMILLGATILAGSLAILITGVGAGIAATMYLIGLSLPTFSAGLKTLSEIDTENFGSLALGLGELGLGLMTFGPFALFGIPAGIALNSLADGVSKLANVDAAKLDQVADALQRVKDATPSATEIVRIGIAAMVSKAVGPSESAAAPAATSSQSPAGEAGINAAGEMKRLNTMTEEMLKVMKENVEYTKRNLSAIKGLSGSGYKF